MYVFTWLKATVLINLVQQIDAVTIQGVVFN